MESWLRFHLPVLKVNVGIALFEVDVGISTTVTKMSRAGKHLFRKWVECCGWRTRWTWDVVNVDDVVQAVGSIFSRSRNVSDES